MGHNGIDEGGATPEDEDGDIDFSLETGDVRLDVLYALDEEEPENETEDETAEEADVSVEATQ